MVVVTVTVVVPLHRVCGRLAKVSGGSTVMSGNGNASVTQTYCGATTEQLTFTITNSIGVGLCCDSGEECGHYRYALVVSGDRSWFMCRGLSYRTSFA